MSAAWLTPPVMFHSSRDFDCEGFEPDQCQYYKEPWHFWYVADWMFALPTVAFFMCTIGVFIIGYALTQILYLSRRPGPSLWRRVVALTRYLSYRGFHVKALGWNSAPVGLLMLAIIGTIYFFCMDLAPSPYYWPGMDMVWGNSPPLGTRSGWLALACMPFVFATASKANWITLVTGITHEKLQVVHRWTSYAFLVLALMHTFPFIVWHIANHDMVDQFNVSNIFEYWTGIVALLFQALLTFASWGPIRKLGYEFFKATHFLSAIVFMVVFFWHCGGTLTSWDYFVATAAVYVPCWAYPLLRTLFEYGIGQKATMSVEDNGFIRITIPVNFTWRPGQHCFLRFRTFGIHALSSSPFTICSLPSTSPKDVSTIVFYIRKRGGFTARLYSYALTQPGAQVPVLVDGPYGGIDNQKFYGNDRIIVVAGGTGVGWMLPLVEQFLRYHSSTVAPNPMSKGTEEYEQTVDENPRQQPARGPRYMRIILATRDVATRTLFHAALNDLLSAYKSPSGPNPAVSIEIHLTGKAERIVLPSSSKPDFDLERSASSSSGRDDEKATIEKHPEAFNKTLRGSDTTAPDDEQEQEVRGRPNLPSIIHEEAASGRETGQTTGVFVCGPLTMQNDVRNAVAGENLNILKSSNAIGGMYLHLEHFSWA